MKCPWIESPPRDPLLGHPAQPNPVQLMIQVSAACNWGLSSSARLQLEAVFPQWTSTMLPQSRCAEALEEKWWQCRRRHKLYRVTRGSKCGPSQWREFYSAAWAVEEVVVKRAGTWSRSSRLCNTVLHTVDLTILCNYQFASWWTMLAIRGVLESI